MAKREPTEFEQKLADLYNSSSPKKQRELDKQLQQVKGTAMATPHALFFLFPGLAKKSLKPKDPNAI